MPRSWFFAAFLILLVILPFAIWGDLLTEWLNVDREAGTLGPHALHGGLVGIALMVADIFLPIPKTAVMAGLGILYGPLIGTLYALAGAVLASVLAYGIGLVLGRPLAQRWMGSELERGQRTFTRHGGLIVAGSRWMPVLSEVIPVVAGVNRMHFPTFAIATVIGSLPHSAVFVTLGHIGSEAPLWTLVISAVIPLALWFVADRAGWTRHLK